MPIFTRRRLQSMLSELADAGVEAPKLADLRARLENKRVDQALPAEMELGIVWALSKLGGVEIEPRWFGVRRPDAFSTQLIPGSGCAVEITAISDARLAQDDDMRRIATRLVEIANRFRRGSGRHLFFQFAEETRRGATGRIRRRRLEKNFVPDATTISAMHAWLAQEGPRGPLRLSQHGTELAVHWKAEPQHAQFNFFSSMPAEAYSLRANPLYEALADKGRQLASPAFSGLRCIVIADAGCRMLRHLDEPMRSQGAVTGRQVIQGFLWDDRPTVDLVITMAPVRQPRFNNYGPGELQWTTSLFARPGLTVDFTGIQKLVGLLPVPRFEGYQARSLQQQGAFRPDARGWYLGMSMSSTGARMTIKISARALLDLLAGRLPLEHFQHQTGLEEAPTQRNIVAHRLEQGDTLSSIGIERAGVDEDDDWLVLQFDRDPAAAGLTVPTKRPGAENA